MQWRRGRRRRCGPFRNAQPPARGRVEGGARRRARESSSLPPEKRHLVVPRIDAPPTSRRQQQVQAAVAKEEEEEEEEEVAEEERDVAVRAPPPRPTSIAMTTTIVTAGAIIIVIEKKNDVLLLVVVFFFFFFLLLSCCDCFCVESSWSALSKRHGASGNGARMRPRARGDAATSSSTWLFIGVRAPSAARSRPEHAMAAASQQPKWAYFQNLNIFSPNAVFSKIAIGVVVQLAKRQRQRPERRKFVARDKKRADDDGRVADAVKIVVFCHSQKDKKKKWP